VLGKSSPFFAKLRDKKVKCCAAKRIDFLDFPTAKHSLLRLQPLHTQILKHLKPSLDWLLVFVPVSFLLAYWPALHNPTALFICSGLAIIPLAGIMGRATEHLAERLGQGIGGLLNATFGNAAELIIALMALHKGLIGVVKASIAGSIIGNILLVLGASLAAGGFKYSHQTFNRTAMQTSTASLVLASIGLLIPTVFHYSAEAQGGWKPAIAERLSLAIAAVLFLTYLCTLAFSLITHKDLYSGKPDAPAHPSSGEPGWSKGKSLLVLLVATIFVAWLSEFLVTTVEATRTQLGVTEVFIGVIVVAIIGNAAEHSTAIWMAVKDKMDLSLGIAIGSSLQMALFVAPVLVFTSWFLGHPMDLEFTIPEVVAVIVAVFIVAEISRDGRTNWLEGVQLLSVYLILAILFYFLPAIR
jgi:Ca2+:H+ antiporter